VSLNKLGDLSRISLKKMGGDVHLVIKTYID
jgi:hypothetical protein